MQFDKKKVQREGPATKKRKKTQHLIQIYQFLIICLKAHRNYLQQEEFRNMLKK
jgi:hypothetical protein